jgi:hypothetical protein
MSNVLENQQFEGYATYEKIHTRGDCGWCCNTLEGRFEDDQIFMPLYVADDLAQHRSK